MKQYIIDYYERWKEKRVRSPYTGNFVKVGSLPPKDQDRYRPFEFHRDDEEEEEDVPDKFDIENKFVFDFYISVPMSWETIGKYLEATDLIPATIDSGCVVDMFPKDDRILKLKGVPVTAVRKYFDLKPDGSNKDTAEFQDIPEMESVELIFDFLRFNEFKIFAIDIDDCVDRITIVNDTPDDDGFVVIRKDDNGVLEAFNTIFGKTSILSELENVDRDTEEDRKVEPEEKDTPVVEPRSDTVDKPEPKPAVKEPEEDKVEVKQDVINFQELVAQQENMIQTLSDIQRTHFNIRELLKNHTIGEFVKDNSINKSNMERYMSEYKMMYRDLLSVYTTISDVLDRLDKNVNELTKSTNVIRK